MNIEQSDQYVGQDKKTLLLVLPLLATNHSCKPVVVVAFLMTNILSCKHIVVVAVVSSFLPCSAKVLGITAGISDLGGIQVTNHGSY